MAAGEPSWAPIDTGDVVVDAFALSHRVHAVGRRRATARHGTATTTAAAVALLTVDDAGHVDVADLPLDGAVGSFVAADLGALLVVEGRPPSILLWCHHPTGAGGTGRDHLDAARHPSVPPDAVRAWATDGEDEIYVSEHADGRLTAYDPAIACRVPEGEGPALRHGAGALVVGAGQGHVAVAGMLAPPGATPSPSVWVITIDTDPSASGGWRELVLDPSPDAVTDLLEGYAVAIAGHVGLQPVVFDDLGRLLESPSVALDPSHPQVLLVDSGAGGRSTYGDERVPGPPIASIGLSVAVQSRDHGPQLWTRGEGGWRVVDLPGSHLQQVATQWLRPEPWLLIDGRLWRPA